MTDRPTCGSCPAFVPHSDTRGSCRLNPPGLAPIVKLAWAEPREGEPARLDGKARSTSYAHWPSVGVDEPCCGQHPAYAGWAKSRPNPTSHVRGDGCVGDEDWPF